MSDPLYIVRGPDAGGNFEKEWTNGSLVIHLLSDVGRKREHNEDSCAMCSPNDARVLDRLGIVVAVADGMGGASAGEHASRLALTSFLNHYYNNLTDSIPEALSAAIKEANRKVNTEANANPEFDGMGTTLSVAILHGDNVYIGQVGDSRVYVQKSNLHVAQVTEDHSLVWEQLRAGIISEEEAKNHSLRNLITRAIGIRTDVDVDLFAMKVAQGDVLIICSDGLSGMIDDDVINAGINRDSMKATNRLLVGKALEAGGADNVTVAAVHFKSAPSQRELQPGCEEVTSASGGFIDRIKKLFG